MAATDSPAAQAPAPDFAGLRQEGLRQLQRLAGPGWTDFNAHDPGITILEQACYALTDLGYRAGHDLADLLAGSGDPAGASLHSPAQILPTSPVTLTDLRKLVIDVPGVQNAWIDIVDEPAARVDAEMAEISPLPASAAAAVAAGLSPNVSDLRLRGLLRVRIEKRDPSIFPGSADLAAEAARRLHRCRSLGTDFQAIEVLAQQPVRLGASIEIAAVDDAAALLAGIYQRIAAYLSPAVPFHSLDEMLARGRRIDEIFEGPLLEQGFIDADELALVERRLALRISDLIQAVMTGPGVLAVKRLHFLDGDANALRPSQDWVQVLDVGKTAWFDLDHSSIQLERGGLRIGDAIKPAALARYKQALKAAQPLQASATERDRRPPPGRDRQVAQYHSIQHQFPANYGIGAAGLPASASRERRALARQLKAYLMFYDQLLANQFAQLANAERLFSFHDESPASYFSQVVADADASLGLEAIRRNKPLDHQRRLEQITEDPAGVDGPAGTRRRNRFLDHLLARYGEQFHDYALMRAGADDDSDSDSDAQLARDKRDFLRDYSRIGHDRGAGPNYLAPADEQNVAGLALALRRKLGVTLAEEGFHLVEHILLRPLPGDVFQQAPLLRGAAASDPYSLQITLVFPNWPARYANHLFVEQTVRDETPAHLSAHLRWLSREQMADFEAAQALWLQRWRAHRRAEFGL